jgi:hypothetical protein
MNTCDDKPVISGKRLISTSPISLIRRHDAFIFAVTLVVQLTILDIMGISGHSSNKYSMRDAFIPKDEHIDWPEECKQNSDAYKTFAKVSFPFLLSPLRGECR